MPDQGAAFVNYGLDIYMNTKCKITVRNRSTHYQLRGIDSTVYHRGSATWQTWTAFSFLLRLISMA